MSFVPSVLDICLWVINNSPSDLVIFLMPIYELVLPMEAIMWEQIRRSNSWQFDMDETCIFICEDVEEGYGYRHHYFARMSYDEETQSLHVESSYGPIHKRERERLYAFHFTLGQDIETVIDMYRYLIWKKSGEFQMVLFPFGLPDIGFEVYNQRLPEDDTSDEEPSEEEQEDAF